MKVINPLFRATIAALSVAACGLATSQTVGDKSATAASSFDKFKALAGDWDGAGGTIRFKVSSGGSVVQEIYFPDTKTEMSNMITRDGADIVLVHYCMMGNQPRMKAPDKLTDNSTAFKFVSLGNMKSDADSHMHNVTYTFVDADTLLEKWSSYKDGKTDGAADEWVVNRKKVTAKPGA